MRLLVLVALVLVVSGSAQAWTMMPGVTLTSPGFEVTSQITYEAADPFYYTSGGHFVLDNVEWRMEPQPGAYWATNLTAYGPTRVHWPGNTTGPGNVTFAGLAGSWRATGIYAFAPFEFNANESWFMTAGPQNTTLTSTAPQLTDTEIAEVQALAAFFSTPFIYVLPFLAGALVLAVLMRRVTGILPNVVLLMVTLAGTFAITSSKDELDAADPLFSPILIVVFLSLVLMQVYRWASGGVNEAHS